MKNKSKVLIFDDEMNELTKMYIGFLLKNFTVEATTDPTEIAERAKRFQPDIVIVNNDVPGFDGHEVCALIKRQMHKPIILLAEKNATQTTRIDHCSADEIIMKPVNMPEMVNTVIRLLATYQ